MKRNPQACRLRFERVSIIFIRNTLNNIRNACIMHAFLVNYIVFRQRNAFFCVCADVYSHHISTHKKLNIIIERVPCAFYNPQACGLQNAHETRSFVCSWCVLYVNYIQTHTQQHTKQHTPSAKGNPQACGLPFAHGTYLFININR